MTDFEQQVADALRGLLVHHTFEYRELATALAPRVTCAIVAAYSDYGDGQRVALEALRGGP